ATDRLALTDAARELVAAEYESASQARRLRALAERSGQRNILTQPIELPAQPLAPSAAAPAGPAVPPAAPPAAPAATSITRATRPAAATRAATTGRGLSRGSPTPCSTPASGCSAPRVPPCTSRRWSGPCAPT